MTKRINHYFIFFLFMLLLVNSCSNAENSGKGSLDLSGKWKIIASDSIDYASPEYDDSKHDDISIPGNWNYILEKNEDLAGTVWLRKKIKIDDNFRDIQFVLSIGRINGAGEVYFNGEFVGKYGRFPSKESRFDYVSDPFMSRNYTFSSKLINFNSENVIAIRSYSHYINGISDNPKIYTISGWQEDSRSREYMPSTLNINPFVILIIPALLFFVIIQGSAENIIAFYCTGLLVAYICFLFAIMGMTENINGLLRFKLVLSLYTIIDFFLVFVVRELLNVKGKWPTLFFFILLIIVNALLFISPTTQHLFFFSGRAAFFLIITYVLYIDFVFISEVVKDPRRYWFLVVLGIIISLSFSRTLYLMMSHQWYNITLGFVMRLPFLLFCGLFLYIYDFKNFKKERNSLAKALLKKTRELKLANRKAGAIDVKPGPRETIHELIEYLDNNFYENYDRIELSKKFGLNEQYLGQLFRNTTGTNITNYINDKRILAARQLLQETESHVIDIAFHVGFDNLSYFNRIFKKSTGKTPREFRKEAVRSDVDSLPLKT